MFGIINKKYPGKQKPFEGFKRSLKETNMKICIILLSSFVLFGLGIKQPIPFVTFVVGGWFGIIITSVFCSGTYHQELKDNMISINPPEQWKVKEES